MLSGSNVAVYSKQGLGSDFIAKRYDFINKFVVGGHFAHFFFGAQMNREVDNVLAE